MAESQVFNAAVRAIVESTSLSELQSRGLVRRLLKQAGLSAEDVTGPQLIVVGRKLLTEALRKNGVEDIQTTLARWSDACARDVDAARVTDRRGISNTVEEVFARIGLGR